MRHALAAICLPLAAPAAAGTATLDVLSYNVEGLPWPARKGRGPSLDAIGDTLGALLRQGTGPDIVLVQERFSGRAKRALRRAGYPAIATGPARTTRKSQRPIGRMPGPFRLGKGELGFHLFGSGLAILSRYPIIAVTREPFGTRQCAGIDCLANKGLLHVRIAMPGVPEPVDLITTHLNSQGASGVDVARHSAAHRLQVAELARFVARRARGDGPLILGGDFNMRHSERRFADFGESNALQLVHQACIAAPHTCDVRLSWDGDEPWMDTQDLQLFGPGRRVTLAPVRVDAMFDGSVGSPKLSDHDGFRVRYRLDWTD